jgi:TRAP-type C4-dicarboxylate transport system permease small subunit
VRAALERLCAGVNWLAERLLAFFIAVTVIAVIAQVVFRYGVQASLTWSEEVARYAFIWAIFVGTSVAARNGQHIVVEALVKTFPRTLQRWLRVFALLVCAAFFALFTWACVLLVENALPQKSAALEISIAWVYAAAVLGGAASVLHFLNGALQPPRPA